MNEVYKHLDEIFEMCYSERDKGYAETVTKTGVNIVVDFYYDHEGGLEGFYSDTYDGTIYIDNEAYTFEINDVFCSETTSSFDRDEEADQKECDDFYKEVITPKQTERRNIMSDLNVVTVILMDEDKNLTGKQSMIAKYEDVVIDRNTDPQEVLLIIAVEEDVKGAIEKHNKAREDIMDKAALQRHGKKVPLQPITIRDVKVIIK